MIGGAAHSIYNPLMVHTTRIPPRSTLQLYTKYQILGRYPLSMESRMMCCKESHPLLLKCLKTFLTCTKRMRGAVNKVFKPLMVHTMLFLPRTTLKLHTTFQVGTVSAYA